MYKSAEKLAAYRRRYNEEHRFEVNAYSREWRRERAEWARAYLGGKCVRCGSTEELQCDHIDATTKSFAIGRIIGWTRERIIEELDKCQLLCARCHRQKTVSNGEYAGDAAEHGSSQMYSRYRCRCADCRSWKREYDRRWKQERAVRQSTPST